MADPDILVMGIDCGGTKTTALLSRRPGEVLSVGTGGPANFQTGGIDNARRAIDAAAEDAFTRAGLPTGPLTALVLGLAGVSRPGDDTWAREWAATRGWCKIVKIVNDTELLLWAGTPHGWGISVVSGTGSMAFGRSPMGGTARSGGWGPLLGDEGSGYAIGRAALQAVTRAADGRAPFTRLTGFVLDHFRLGDPSDLVQKVYQDGLSRTNISSLAGLVNRAAGDGDTVALEIEEQAAAELALAFGSVARQLGFAGPVPCALGGGVLVHNPRMVERMISFAACPVFWPQPVLTVIRPAEGALRLAWQEVGQS